MSEIKSNREYKDGVFTKLFHDKKKIIELVYIHNKRV